MKPVKIFTLMVLLITAALGSTAFINVKLLNKINDITSAKVRCIPLQAVIFCWPYCLS